MLENMKMLLAAASKVAISSKPIFLYKRWNKYKSSQYDILKHHLFESWPEREDRKQQSTTYLVMWDSNPAFSVEHWAAIWDSDMFGEEIDLQLQIKLWTEKFGKLREVFWKYISICM